MADGVDPYLALSNREQFIFTVLQYFQFRNSVAWHKCHWGSSQTSFTILPLGPIVPTFIWKGPEAHHAMPTLLDRHRYAAGSQRRQGPRALSSLLAKNEYIVPGMTTQGDQWGPDVSSKISTVFPSNHLLPIDNVVPPVSFLGPA